MEQDFTTAPGQEQNQINDSGNSKKRRPVRSTLARLIKSTVALIFLAAVIMHILYFFQLYREAPHDSLYVIIRLCMGFSLLLTIFSFYGLVFYLYYLIRKRQLVYISGAAGYAALMLLGFIFCLAAALLIGAAEGNFHAL